MLFEDSEYITNLKLQKLLYYIQGEYMAKMNTPLFNDDFLAWEHGPIIREVYDKYKQNGSYGIKNEEDFTENIDGNDEN